jgi:putative molybdopterin biosynthesis protein
MEERYLSPKEAAEILSVKKTTVYDMIKQGRLKAAKIGKQFRICESDVLALVNGGTRPEPEAPRPQELARAGGEVLLCGQDMLLDSICARVNAAEGAQRVRRAYLGSYNGLYALYQGNADLATAHLWDSETDSYNLPFVKKILPGMDVQVYHIVNRPIGIYTAPGNPKHITSIEDFARPEVRIVNREKGSGIRVLTDSLLLQRGIDPGAVQGYGQVCNSHAAVAAAVAQGTADCAFGDARTVLGMPEVEFQFFKYEQYDLIVPASALSSPVVGRVIDVLGSPALRLETEALGGYDPKDMGKRLL